MFSKIINFFGSIERDKLLHMLLSIMIVQLCVIGFKHSLCGSGPIVLISAAIALVIGVLKEVYDEKFGSGAEMRDFLYDAIGIGIASILSYLMIM